jgi:sucrose-6F-phosphate phosphohydrolase
MKTHRLLLCTDLDRTLIPNGAQEESPDALAYFAQLVAHELVTLAYVTGRHQALVEEAIQCYSLPRPDLVIGDVGTTIYDTQDNNWEPWTSWEREIKPQWSGLSHSDLKNLFQDLDILRLQELEKQNTFKLSYYLPLHTDVEPLLAEMEERLKRNGVHASLIYSIDEVADIGLLDLLPQNATKLHAIQYVREHLGYTLSETVFSGDSGNDIPVLSSEIQGTLVANATEQVRQHALAEAKDNNHLEALYLARGGYLGMNGNYSAGILEGIVHYCPYTRHWIEEK